ncbi:MAG: hypothetical protein Q9175_001688 [Cornicularia normoerica]
MAIHILSTSALIFALRTAAFNLYPTVNPDNLAKSFGISIECLDALNETSTCDQTLFQMSNTVDSYLWTTDNVTNLCTAACITSTANWWSDVQNRCATDTIAAHGKMIPAESIAGRFFDGLNIACLQSDSSSNSSGSYSNASSSPTASAPYSISSSAFTVTAPYSNSSSTSNTTSSGSSWCLIESQDWAGSDIIRPDCSTNSTDPSCLDPLHVSPQNERIANLYPKDMLCSDCFIKMFHQRMSSPYLPDSDYSDYLVAQYQDILDVCKASMPELIVRSLPFYGDAQVAFGALSSSNPTMPPFSSNGTQYTDVTNSTTPCTGQTIRIADLNGTAFSNPNASLCDALSNYYGVTTGDVEAVLENPDCLPVFFSYCVPAACTLMTVPSGATCDSIASSNSITTLQFMKWNANINGLCDNLQEGDYVCIGAPGGSYIPPRISNASTNANAQQYGRGTGPPSNSTAPFTNSTVPTNTTLSPPSGSSGSESSAPSPTQKGISASCTKYSQAKQGESCFTFALKNNIAAAQLYTLNGALGNTGQNCDTTFWSDYYYCMASSDAPAAGDLNSTATPVVTSTIDATPTSTTATTITASAPTLDPVPTPRIANAPVSAPAPTAASPSPTQSGIALPCAKYAQAHTGDTCSSFAAVNKITPADLYTRNSALGDNGRDCDTKFWAGYYYCVGGTD